MAIKRELLTAIGSEVTLAQAALAQAASCEDSSPPLEADRQKAQIIIDQIPRLIAQAQLAGANYTKVCEVFQDGDIDFPTLKDFEFSKFPKREWLKGAKRLVYKYCAESGLQPTFSRSYYVCRERGPYSGLHIQWDRARLATLLHDQHQTQKKQALINCVVTAYFKHDRRRQYINLAPQILQKLAAVEKQGLLTPLREFILVSGIAQNRRTAYIHAHMLSSHVARIQESLAAVDGSSIPEVSVFEDNKLHQEAVDDWEIFLAEEGAEQAT